MARTELFARRQVGGMFTVVNNSMTTGNIFFVHSGTGTNGAGYGQNPDAPVASIDYAVGLCTANQGDRIYVMPGHVETVATASGLAADVAGVEIIGIGTEAKLAARAAIVALGFDQATVDSVWANSETLRDAINWHGRLNNADFDVNAFSLSQF